MNIFPPNRTHPHFSLRTLVGFVTLICLYFGAWEMTKTAGPRAVAEKLKGNVMDPADMTCQAPFLVSTFWCEPDVKASAYPQTLGPERRHFVWLGGPVVQLPLWFTSIVEHLESKWYELSDQNPPTAPQRVHGGVI